MNPEIKKQWVDALRSGKYKQYKGALRGINKNGDTSYCCLGVLCELHRKKMKKKGWQCDTNNRLHVYAGRHSYLPNKVVKWADLEHASPYIPSKKEALSDLNDNAGTER